MQTTRALVAGDPRCFGRGRVRHDELPQERRWSLSDDTQLFAATFAAAFLFVSILIA